MPNQTRRVKIDWINTMIKAAMDKNIEVSKVRLIAEFAMANNSTERTGREIIELLEKTDRIKVEGDIITA